MNSTRGHQLVVNEYFAECLRKAKEREAERDAHIKRLQEQDRDSVAAHPPEGPTPMP
jgi:hypothetical protein